MTISPEDMNHVGLEWRRFQTLWGSGRSWTSGSPSIRIRYRAVVEYRQRAKKKKKETE